MNKNSKKHSTSTFQDEWFTDERFRLWIGKTQNPKEGRCLICKKDFDISLMGVAALTSHAKGQKHNSKLSDKSSSADIRLMLGGSMNKENIRPTTDKQKDSETNKQTVKSSDIPSSSMDKLIANQANTLNAEILWCLRMVQAHESYNSCSDLSALFQRMFAGNEVAEKFSLGKTKSRYTMIYGIAPVFKKELLFDVNRSPFFTISFDESLNSELQMCQMDVALRFWNEKKGQAETKYYDSQFLSRPNAENLYAGLETSMKGLDKANLLQLAMDGPKVNWNVLSILNDKLESENFSKTIDIGSCAQHTIHGAFKDGFQKSSWKIDKLLKSIFWLLNDSPARRDVYLTEGNTITFPLRSVCFKCFFK